MTAGPVQIPVADALARLLVAAGVKAIWGIAGGKMTPFLKAIHAAGTPAFLGTRHEAAAAMAATVDGMVTATPGVAMAEQGPGMVNLLAGLGPAFANGLPLIAITISTPLAVSSPARGAMMEVDAAALFQAMVKASYRLIEPRRLPDLLRRAFREAMSGRPGPVHLDIPADVLAMTSVFDPAGLDVRLTPPPRPAADPAGIAEVVRHLAQARRPVILLGGGVVRARAWPQARKLAERLQAPVLLSQMALGVLPGDHPLLAGQGGVIGGPQVLRALDEADLVLSIGCRLSSWFWGANGPALGPTTALIQIDIAAEQIGLSAPVALGLQADAGLALDSLLAAVAGPAAERDVHWAAGLIADRAAHLARLDHTETDSALHPAVLARALGQALPDDALVTLDGGHTSFWHNDLLPATLPLQLFHDPGQGQLGFGLPYALALKRAFPDRPVICTIGDGSFGFTLAELDTARRLGLAVIVVIHNNHAWGVIAANQSKAGFAMATDLGATDYAAVARGFGCRGEVVETLDEFRAAFAAALTSDQPSVLDCRTAFVAHPMLPAFGRTTSAPPTDQPLPW